jgi:DNA polymerase I-like protein with 3'-5' exonuclease and polymerase domains
MWGSNPVAQFIKYAMIRADQHPMLAGTNTLSIHDELTYVVDARFEPQKVKEWIEEIMCFNLPEIPTMKLRVDVSYGENWADQREIVP